MITIPKTIGFRPDDEVGAAINDLGVRLGTTNVSQIIRIGFMSGYREINNLPAALVRQSFREGVLAGAGAFKAHLESAIAAALKEIT